MDMDAINDDRVRLYFPICPLCGEKDALHLEFSFSRSLFSPGRSVGIVTCDACDAEWSAQCGFGSIYDINSMTLKRPGTHPRAQKKLGKNFDRRFWESLINPELPDTPLDIRAIFRHVDRETIIDWMEGENRSIAYTKSEICTASQKRGTGSGDVIFGYTIKRFPFEHVLSLDFQRGVSLQLEIRMPGERTRKIPGLTVGAGEPENVVLFPLTASERLTSFLERLRKTMDKYKSGSTQGRSVESLKVTRDPIEQIRKLAALRDSGVITAEEFQKKKVELLKKI